MEKETRTIWDFNVDNMVAWKLIKTKNNSKHSIRCLDEAKKILVLILPKMTGYFKTFKVKDENKDNKLMFLCIWWKKRKV